MGNIIGVSAYNLHDEAYEYNEDECFIADSVESLRDFLKGAGFFLEHYRAVNVDISDIMKDYGVSFGRYCMEPEVLKRFEKVALSHGITYHLEEYDEGLVNVKVDLPRIEETEAEETDAKLAPWIQKIDVESLNNLTGEMRADLLSEINYNKGYEERLAQYRLDKKDVLEGLLVSFTNIVSDRGSVAYGGKDATFRFLHKGHEYLVDDLYCPNPNCNCRKIYLLFFELISNISGSANIIDCFMATITFKGKIQPFQLYRNYDARDAQMLMDAWKEQYSNALNVLKRRYQEIKQVGERSLRGKEFFKIQEPDTEPVIREKKIGRNEPCPCGSGKKYKKCCGAG